MLYADTLRSLPLELQLVMTMMGLGRLARLSPGVAALEELEDATLQRALPSATPRDAAQLLVAWAQLCYTPSPQWLDAARAALFRQPHGGRAPEQQTTSLALWAMAVLQRPPPHRWLLDALQASAPLLAAAPDVSLAQVRCLQPTKSHPNLHACPRLAAVPDPSLTRVHCMPAHCLLACAPVLIPGTAIVCQICCRLVCCLFQQLQFVASLGHVHSLGVAHVSHELLACLALGTARRDAAATAALAAGHAGRHPFSLPSSLDHRRAVSVR
jgi:hypothetical protein